MKNMQTSYNYNANRVKQAVQEKSVKENLNFLIDLGTIAMITEDNKTTKEEPQIFNNEWNHPSDESKRK